MAGKAEGQNRYPILAFDLERETGFEPATLSLGSPSGGLGTASEGLHGVAQAPQLPENTGDSEKGVSHPFAPASPTRTRFVTPLLQGKAAGKGRKPKVLGTLQTGAGGRLLTVREVAAHLGVSRATVYKLCASGDLPAIRVGAALRISAASLASWGAGQER